ncbi:MAG: capsular biosynthesis protein [Bacteroidales bacterium]|nr:capsular biosynthesis protein [Bacteroidales bacterium]
MKVVFLLKTIEQQRCIKRIQAFIDHGYEVEVYGFNRKHAIHQQYNFQINSLGVIEDGTSYVHRTKEYLKGRTIIKKYRKEKNVLFYLFGLDLALPIILCRGANHYIYEESDLIHTKFKSRAIIRLFESIDKRIIKKSKVSVLTSEGFVKYHYGDTTTPQNVCILPNKLNQRCKELSPIQRVLDVNNLSVGFVGFFRYESIYNFLLVTAKRYPNIQVKLFGANSGWTEKQMTDLFSLPNVSNEGPFKNPVELPDVYSKIDLVVSTYDIEDDNPRFAEPNKIYESIYFETPIIVSSQTFLAEKVDSLGIGFNVNAKNDDEIIDFWESLTEQVLKKKKDACRKTDKNYCIDDETELFDKLK